MLTCTAHICLLYKSTDVYSFIIKYNIIHSVFLTQPNLYLLEPLMVMSCAIFSACLGCRLCHSPFKSRAHTLNRIMSALACCSGYEDCWTLCWVSPHSITQTFCVSWHKCKTKVDLPKASLVRFIVFGNLCFDMELALACFAMNS